MLRFRLLAVLLAASLTCSAAPASAGHIAPLAYATTLVQVPVLLRPADRDRVDTIAGASPARLHSGEVFAAVFTGTAGREVPVVEITATQSHREVGAFGLRARYSYQISAVLRLHGKEHVLKATGIETQRGTRAPAIHAQLACERAAVDLAKQVQTLLVRGQHSGDAAPGEFRMHRPNPLNAG
ncbi:MAG TPA: hypothetical protein VHE61_14655 [Opitutaceae bacterium]|nr:hypothetical protein [Opitutaceae bacterium]